MTINARFLTDFDVKILASDARSVQLSPSTTVEFRRAVEGDLLLAKVDSSDGEYQEVEGADGRSARMFRGDLFVGVLANRDSLRYFSGHVPEGGIDLSQADLRLISNGGIVAPAGTVPAYLKSPMRVRPLGVLVDDGSAVNLLARLRTAEVGEISGGPPIVLVCASATDAGKTTFAGSLIHELNVAGIDTASMKLAGTGCLEDVLLHRDAGAQWVFDFPDVGLASTYTSPINYRPAARMLVERASATGAGVIVAELGGDILWANIPTLLQMRDISALVHSIFFIPGDVTAAVGADMLLRNWGASAPVTWVIPSHRNPEAFRRRMDAFVPGPSVDARDRAAIRRVAEQIARDLGERMVETQCEAN